MAYSPSTTALPMFQLCEMFFLLLTFEEILGKNVLLMFYQFFVSHELTYKVILILFLLYLTFVLVGVSIVVKRYHDHTTLIKKSISLELANIFRGLVNYWHGWKHGIVQTDAVLKR